MKDNYIKAKEPSRGLSLLVYSYSWFSTSSCQPVKHLPKRQTEIKNWFVRTAYLNTIRNKVFLGKTQVSTKPAPSFSKNIGMR